jgi:hypothetical protein
MELYLHASMRLYGRHTEKIISYETAVPDKTKFISVLHERQTDTQTDRHTDRHADRQTYR